MCRRFFRALPSPPPPLHAPSLAGRDLLASHSMRHEQGDPCLRRYSILLLHSRNDCFDRFVAQFPKNQTRLNASVNDRLIRFSLQGMILLTSYTTQTTVPRGFDRPLRFLQTYNIGSFKSRQHTATGRLRCHARRRSNASLTAACASINAYSLHYDHTIEQFA